MVRFTEDHEWIRLEGDNAVIGISDYAQRELGDITYVELPEVGAEYAAGDSFCVVESVKAASDVFAPVDGKVASVNESLEDAPEMINDAAESEGWICTMSGVDAAVLEGLMTADEYNAYCQTL